MAELAGICHRRRSRACTGDSLHSSHSMPVIAADANSRPVDFRLRSQEKSPALAAFWPRSGRRRSATSISHPPAEPPSFPSPFSCSLFLVPSPVPGTGHLPVLVRSFHRRTACPPQPGIQQPTPVDPNVGRAGSAAEFRPLRLWQAVRRWKPIPRVFPPASSVSQEV